MEYSTNLEKYMLSMFVRETTIKDQLTLKLKEPQALTYVKHGILRSDDVCASPTARPVLSDFLASSVLERA